MRCTASNDDEHAREGDDAGRRTPLPNGPDRIPAEIDTTVAHEAQVYDLLGGTVNFEVDREAAMRAAAAVGGIETAGLGCAATARSWPRRCATWSPRPASASSSTSARASPAPTTSPTSRTLAPDARRLRRQRSDRARLRARVAAQHAGGTAAYIEGDLREPEDVLRRASATLDLDEPVGLILVAVLHHITDDQNPYGLVARLVDALASGSYLVVTQLASDLHREGMTALSQSVPAQARYSFAGRRAAARSPASSRASSWSSRAWCPSTSGAPRTCPKPPDPAHPAWHYGAIGRKPQLRHAEGPGGGIARSGALAQRQRPVKSGSRFARKACGPSRASSLAMTSMPSSNSRA